QPAYVVGTKRSLSGLHKHSRHTGLCSSKRLNNATGQPTYPVCRNYGNRHGGECRKMSGLCFNCGKPGHMVRDCPCPRVNRVPGV
ncbi:UNVERIFIED_CONTAM: zinc finger domain-containing protein, partial [Salmonella enterica subsp. enterica serovar Weltevreden]